jgi:4-amino-4-deoxy-L-arabinose transferase-like glycosyltransferase
LQTEQGGESQERTSSGAPVSAAPPRMVTPDEAGLRSASRWWSRLGLAVIVLLGTGLRLWRLAQNGYGNAYYTAGVRSMMHSPHNFFFNSFDPAGFVSLDKPPVALWIQVVSAKLFGFSGLCVLVPQAVEGVVAIVLVSYLVKRRFGPLAGLLAALFLALTPISVAIDRSSNTDSCLVLVLLLAAWALTQAAEVGRWHLLLLSMALVGVGFNVKMLAAFVVLPTFACTYWVGAPIAWRRRLSHLATASVVLAAVSLSWIVVYDLTPPESRPFVGSSKGNSMLELAIGHNGLERFVRRRGRLAGPLGGEPAGNTVSRGPDSSAGDITVQQDPTGSPSDPALALPSSQGTQTGADPSTPGGAGSPLGARPDFAVQVPIGPLRLADRHLASQVGWLLPLALMGLIVTALRVRRCWPLTPAHLALLLWSGWALTYGIVYSYTGGIFHAYYLVTMAPPLSALAGIGVASLWSYYRQGGRRSLLLPVTFLMTAAWQAYIEYAYLGWQLAGSQRSWTAFLAAPRAQLGDWRTWLYLALVGGALVAAVGLVVARSRIAWSRPGRSLASVALGVGLLALLVTPTAWALSSVLVRGNGPLTLANLSILAGGDGSAALPPAGGFGGAAGVQILAAFLRANHRGERYLLATLTARQAAPMIIQTGEAVMAMGGFTGSDPIITPEGLARMVEDRQVRFVLLGGFGGFVLRLGGEAQQRALIDWIRANGKLVDPTLWRSTATDAGPGLAPGRRRLPPGDRDPAIRPAPVGPYGAPGPSGRGFPGSTGRPQLFDLRPTDSVVPAL